MRTIVPVRVLSYPALEREVREKPLYAGQVWDEYELGSVKIRGPLVIHDVHFPVCGEEVQVVLTEPRSPGKAVYWTGIVMQWKRTEYGYAQIDIQPTGKPVVGAYPPKRTRMDFPINYLEDTKMKVFDGIVVELDEKREPKSVSKVIPPFVAEDAKTAREQVLVDFATEKQIAGKDLAGYSVRVREFCATAS